MRDAETLVEPLHPELVDSRVENGIEGPQGVVPASAVRQLVDYLAARVVLTSNPQETMSNHHMQGTDAVIIVVGPEENAELCH